MITDKHCNSCDTTKNADDFYFRDKAKGLRESRCKKCSNQYTRDFKRRNPDKQHEYSKTDRSRHTDRIKESGRRNYERKSDDVKARSKQWAAEHPEKRRINLQRYWDKRKSPYGFELRQAIRAIQTLEEVIENGEKQD